MVDSRTACAGQPSGGVRGDRRQGRAFGVEPATWRRPGRRGPGTGVAGGRDPGPAIGLGRVQRVHRGGGGGQVVVEQAGQVAARASSSPFSVARLAGVGAQQVVHAVPAGAGGVDEVGPGELVEHAAGVVEAGAGQRGRGEGVHVGAGVQAEQPEHARGVGRQVLDRPGEHRGHGRARVAAGVEQVQPPAGRPARPRARPATSWAGCRPARRRPAAPAAAGRTARRDRRRRPARRRPGRRSAGAATRPRPPAGSRSRSRRWAPSRATSPARVSRLVTSTTQVR